MGGAQPARLESIAPAILGRLAKWRARLCSLLAAESSLVLCICTCTLYTWGFSHLQQAPRSPGEPGAGASCQRGPSQEPLFSLWAWASIAPPNHGEVMSGPFVVAEVYSVETRPNTHPVEDGPQRPSRTRWRVPVCRVAPGGTMGSAGNKGEPGRLCGWETDAPSLRSRVLPGGAI